MKSLKHLLQKILIDSPAEMVMKRFGLSVVEYTDAKKEYFRLVEAHSVDAWSGKTPLRVGVMDDDDMLFLYLEGDGLDITVAITKEVFKIEQQPAQSLLTVDSNAENIGIELLIPRKDGIYTVQVISDIKVADVVVEVKHGRISFSLPKKATQRKPGRKKKTSEETSIQAEAGQTACDASSNETSVGIQD